MTVNNGYLTLAEFKAYRGGTYEPDPTDDSTIEAMIEAASRFHESETGRTFYPRVETAYLDAIGDREQRLPDDLLAAITLTNGDGASIASTNFNLYPLNTTPKIALRLKASSSYGWEVDSSGNAEGVVSLNGFWGYHNRYAQEGWKSLSTLNNAGALNATSLTFTVTSAINFAAGQIIKIENELMIVGSTNGNVVTVLARGDNGSTAATHADGSTVYLWQFQTDIRQSVFELASAMYGRRSGDNQAGESIITTSGALITTRNIPAYTMSVIRMYRRYL